MANLIGNLLRLISNSYCFSNYGSMEQIDILHELHTASEAQTFEHCS